MASTKREKGDGPRKRAAPARPRKMGRPSAYTAAIADRICRELADGRSLRSICLDEKMPTKHSVFRWLQHPDRDDFRTQYARARELQADSFVDDIVDIADDASNDTIETEAGERANAEWISRSKVRIDTRKWVAARMAPKKYGDKLELGGAGKDGAITVEIVRLSEAAGA
jgi:hypothetical protein